MLIEQAKKLTPFERMVYWIKERQQIYLKKEAGLPKPWTDDKVLQEFYFCNVYREQDKTTKWFRENIREPFRDDSRVLMATVIFRWFNKIETGQALIDWQMCADRDKRSLFHVWDEQGAIHTLRTINKVRPVFTSAYMIKCGNGPPGCKIPMVCNAITQVRKCQEMLVEKCLESNSLEQSHKAFTQFKGLGGFMAYEIVTDLRHTYLLEKATDIDIWANPGPGCLRGLSWLVSDNQNHKVLRPLEKMKDLLSRLRKVLPGYNFEMRDVEHLLCETDKYNRALYGTGKMKRRYNGRV